MDISNQRILCICLGVLCLALPAISAPANLAAPAKPMIYSMRTLENLNYQDEVVKLALEKTKAEFGPYRIEKAGKMNISRAMNAVALNAFNNLIVANGYEKEFTQMGAMSYIPVPVDLGLTGFRLCITSKANKTKFSQITTVQQLKQFSIIQGFGWPDASILKANGFKVIEISDSAAENMLKMVAAGRGDLYCQSLSQYWMEYSTFKETIGIDLNETFVLYYPLARFFYVNKSYPVEANRLRKGLELAAKDGSLAQLWFQHNQASFDHANLKQRRLFTLNNPHLDMLDKGYQHFFVDPFAL
jgi:hypothetical protein